MRIPILSWLLYHANKSKNILFYPIKSQILEKYGRTTGTIVQHIPGKKCFSCCGTGNHTYYDWHGCAYDHAPCWNCNGSGWFKRPRWNWLREIRFGKYVFHQPFATTYEEPAESVQQFEGYVEHQDSKYTDMALFIIFLVYERGFLNRWWNNEIHPYRWKWWIPRNYIINIIHILKHGRNAYPFRQLRKPKYSPDDLPF